MDGPNYALLAWAVAARLRRWYQRRTEQDHHGDHDRWSHPGSEPMLPTLGATRATCS